MVEKKPVVVIGAGCAGLSAAYTLGKAGVECIVLEGSDRAGGRVGNRSAHGFTWATGAAMTEPQWETTFEYLEELGLRDRVDTVESQVYGFWSGGRRRFVRLGKGMNPFKLLGFFLGRGLPFSTYPQLLRFAAAIRPYSSRIGAKGGHDFSGLMEIASMSTEEFGRKNGGASLTDRILNPFLGTMVLGRARDVSIAHPIALMSLMRGMCTVDGGLAVFIDALYEQVRDRVRLSTPVQEVVIEDGKVVGVRTADGLIETSQVILATDAADAIRLVPELPETMRAPLSACTYSSTYNYVFGLNRRIVPDDFLSLMIPASANSLITTIFDENSGVSSPRGPEGTGLVHAFTAGWHDDTLSAVDDETRRRLVIREIQRFLPEFPDEPLFTDVIRYDRAISLEAPEQVTAIHDLNDHHLRDVPGLYLAGEYLFLIACTEGALSTGKRAAQMAVADR
ncbi:NAD(P)/FAD-dependent oxidoreductase [Actinotalea sp.]|uniref:protoporphyrinogen/coproporphyrinogen oxidase n=1 Tax=Actinotalea sp. TaxID=1872145 RepID=UPI00356A0064